MADVVTAATPTPALASRRARSFDPRRARIVVAVLAVLLFGAIACFMTYDLKGSLSFALELRSRKVATMVVVGAGLGTSAVLFHTVSGNRILTPSLMGFDSLYILIQTVAAYLLGTFAYLSIDPRLRFGAEVLVMIAFALLLNRLFLSRARNDLALLLLGGIVLGGVFASVSNLVARLIDPNEFVTLQDQFFASFATVDEQLLGISTMAFVAVLTIVWRMRHRLDVMALGREQAISLGVDVDLTTRIVMALVAVLVSVSTALVGPITFLGLLVSNFAYQATGTFRHRYTVVATCLAGAGALVAAQFVLEELFDFTTRSSIIISFFGGVAFIIVLMKESRR